MISYAGPLRFESLAKFIMPVLVRSWTYSPRTEHRVRCEEVLQYIVTYVTDHVSSLRLPSHAFPCSVFRRHLFKLGFTPLGISAVLGRRICPAPLVWLITIKKMCRKMLWNKFQGTIVGSQGRGNGDGNQMLRLITEKLFSKDRKSVHQENRVSLNGFQILPVLICSRHQQPN